MIIGGGVALNLAPEDWSADSPDARLLLVVRRPAVAHACHDPRYAVVSGLRYRAEDDLEPQRVTVKVRTGALPPDVRVEAGRIMMPPPGRSTERQAQRALPRSTP